MTDGSAWQLDPLPGSHSQPAPAAAAEGGHSACSGFSSHTAPDVSQPETWVQLRSSRKGETGALASGLKPAKAQGRPPGQEVWKEGRDLPGRQHAPLLWRSESRAQARKRVGSRVGCVGDSRSLHSVAVASRRACC